MRVGSAGQANRLAVGAATLLVSLVLCAPSGAAMLRPARDSQGYSPTVNAVYDAGSEANHVTVAGTGPSLYLVRDPNVAISTPPFQRPDVDTNPINLLNVGYVPLYASWNCIAPGGRGQGVCLVTPGMTCNESGCGFHENARFGALFLLLHGGSDSVTLAPRAGPTYVYLGDGNDTADARNGVVDWIDCGAGADVVAANPADNVASSCETVTRGR